MATKEKVQVNPSKSPLGRDMYGRPITEVDPELLKDIEDEYLDKEDEDNVYPNDA